MKTAIQQLIERYSEHLKHDDDLEQMSGKDILKIVLVDLISYQVKENEQMNHIVDTNEMVSDNVLFEQATVAMEEIYGSGCDTEIDAYFRGAKWAMSIIRDKNTH